MAEFDRQIRQTIEDFALSMQFTAPPQPGADGSYNFIFERSGTLTLISAGDGRHVIIALGRRPPVSGEEGMMHFFAAAGLDPATNQALHAGIGPDGNFYYAMILPNSSFDLPALENAFSLLIEAHDALRL